MGGEEIIEYVNTLTPSRRGEHALGSSTESMRSTYSKFHVIRTPSGGSRLDVLIASSPNQWG